MSHTSKNIIICSDGTGNTANKDRGTNVFKLFEAVDVIGHLHELDKSEQVEIYDDGVATQEVKALRLIGGAFGIGLARNVRQLYAELESPPAFLGYDPLGSLNYMWQAVPSQDSRTNLASTSLGGAWPTALDAVQFRPEAPNRKVQGP